MRTIVPTRLAAGHPRRNGCTVMVSLGQIKTVEEATEVHRKTDVSSLHGVRSRYCSDRDDGSSRSS